MVKYKYMDKIDALIKKLQEAKEELNKADYKRPDAGFGSVTVKDTAPKMSPAINPKKPFGSVMVKEDLMCSANGQWKLMEKASANPALEPKEVKIKELQSKIDAGTYKPDAGKIAAAMESHPSKPLKKSEEELDKAMNAGVESKPVFSMDHIKEAAGSKDHGAAKKMAHDAVDSSSAHPHNKVKAKQMIDSSKSSSHLAQGMTNFHMTHDAKIRTRLNGNKD